VNVKQMRLQPSNKITLVQCNKSLFDLQHFVMKHCKLPCRKPIQICYSRKYTESWTLH